MSDDAHFCGYCGSPLDREGDGPQDPARVDTETYEQATPGERWEPPRGSPVSVRERSSSDSGTERSLWDRLGPPAKWSLGLGLALPILGWVAASDFSASGILALVVVIPIWIGALRLLILLGQIVGGRR